MWWKRSSQATMTCQENEDQKKNQKFERLIFYLGGHLPNLDVEFSTRLGELM